MQCEQARRQLNALADGELAEANASRIGRHLAECGACREEWERIFALGELARSWRDVCAPPNLRMQIAAALWASESAGCGGGAAGTPTEDSGMSALRAFLARGGDDGTKGTEQT